MTSLSSSPISAPPRAPKSLCVLGIIAIILACLAIALTIVLALITIAAMREVEVPQSYINAIIALNAVSVLLSLLELTAGIGMTCLKRWGRTLGLLYAFASIPLDVLLFLASIVIINMANFAVMEGGSSHSGVMQIKEVTGKPCVTLPFSIVLIFMLLTGKMRAWAKTSRTAPPTASPQAASLPQPASKPAVSAAAISTLPADLPLSFPSQHASKPPPSSPITVSAHVPLAIAASTLAPSAATPAPPIPVVAPSPAIPATIPPAPTESRLSVAALLSLILAFVPFVMLTQIASLIFGIVGLKRIARSNGALRGKGMAITGIIISALLLLLVGGIIALFVILRASATRESVVTDNAATEKSAFYDEAGHPVIPPETPQRLSPRLQFRLAAPADDTTAGTEEFDDPSNPGQTLRLRSRILIDDSVLASASLNSGNSEAPSITIEFTQAGAAAFAQITRDHLDQPLAVVLDGKILCVATIQSEITNGRCVLSLSSATSRNDAQKLANTLAGLANK